MIDSSGEAPVSPLPASLAQFVLPLSEYSLTHFAQKRGLSKVYEYMNIGLEITQTRFYLLNLLLSFQRGKGHVCQNT